MIRALTAIVLLAGLGGCAPLVEMDKPSPEGPRISHLRFTPTETMAGCPVRAKFRLETTTEEIVSANEAWVRRHGRSAEYRYAMLPVDFNALRDKRNGEIEAQFVPRDSGTFYRGKTCCDPSRANRRRVEALADVLGRKV